ncbi:DUF2252 domain-containing protein [Actinospica durhamensis]|uniref:DUF2252 domain-containing protein n=1 Tax=Actinospica durhamensis TaxID=1508375 RepID=A0A941ERJ9_9ACTN|nr:DUF2252 domain-containing protein [Actinospica durhamensis]MBR7833799.1 DUF2252 domain-containing protein [Actinospica durhamensis]
MKTTVRDSAEAGLAARAACPPVEHAALDLPADRPDPVAVLERQAVSRVPELVPVRHGRMLASPFAYFRGAAAMMAHDLAATPDSGLRTQLCGDAHLCNFGMFASPERRLVFDLNDFDETYPGPWEWDVKRLAASLEIAARSNDFGHKHRRAIQLATVRAYQQAMNSFAGMHELDLWYARADVEDIKDMLRDQLKKSRRKAAFDKTVAKARSRDSQRSMAKLTELVGAHRRITADPPLVVPVQDLLPDGEQDTFVAAMRGMLGQYRSTLQSDRRRLLDQFVFADLARKVVGVGSVGTRCWIVLMFGRDSQDPLFLQVKEAQRSVIAEYGGVRAGRMDTGCQGRRVVDGQRLMQTVSDIFLGWATVDGIDGQQRDFYARQLADWKGSVAIEEMVPSGMTAYGRLCGWTLARAHARSGDRVALSAYLGEDATFAHAIAEFAEAYAEQNERDYDAMRAALRSGRITAEPDHR